MKFDTFYQKIQTMQMLEMQAEERMEQANAIREELRQALGDSTKTDAAIKIVLASSAKEDKFKQPNGPMAKIISYLKSNSPNTYSVPELCKFLSLSTGQVYNGVQLALKCDKIKRVSRGTYCYKG